MIHPVLDRLITAKRLTQSQPDDDTIPTKFATIYFGDYGKVEKFQEEHWLDYSHYNTDTYHCGERSAVAGERERVVVVLWLLLHACCSVAYDSYIN
jgi:hypothetical protein